MMLLPCKTAGPVKIAALRGYAHGTSGQPKARNWCLLAEGNADIGQMRCNVRL
jgi:hypothetical protein